MHYNMFYCKSSTYYCFDNGITIGDPTFNKALDEMMSRIKSGNIQGTLRSSSQLRRVRIILLPLFFSAFLGPKICTCSL